MTKLKQSEQIENIVSLSSLTSLSLLLPHILPSQCFAQLLVILHPLILCSHLGLGGSSSTIISILSNNVLQEIAEILGFLNKGEDVIEYLAEVANDIPEDIAS